MHAPWDLAPHLPWHTFSNPADQWSVMPSFLLGEYLFYACAALAFTHAWKQGAERTQAPARVVPAALLAGTANDMIFMALPLVDNFWQAQGTIMLTPRLPAVHPLRLRLLHVRSRRVSVWRLGLPPLARAALTAWPAACSTPPTTSPAPSSCRWTWHDSDAPIRQPTPRRPIGSTMCLVITLVAAFSWLLGKATDRDPAVSWQDGRQGPGAGVRPQHAADDAAAQRPSAARRRRPGPIGLVTGDRRPRLS